MYFIKKIIKTILPKKYVTFLRGKINHEGYLLMFFPPLKLILRYLPNNILLILMNRKILSYDYTINYAIPRKIRKKIMNSYDKDKFYLNIGGGFNENKRNWRILEYSGDPIQNIGYRYHKELIDYNIDLMVEKKWEIKDETVHLVYTSHCLEHITQSATEFLFNEVYRILKPNGIFRISVPNSDLAYEALKKGNLNFFMAFNDQEKILDIKNEDKISSLIEAGFLKFFSSYKLDENSYSEFQNDFKNLDKTKLFNKYTSNQKDEYNYHAHINWFNFKKIKEIGIKSNFKEEKIILSEKNKSISKEMQSGEFDKTAPNYSIYVDIAKN